MQSNWGKVVGVFLVLAAIGGAVAWKYLKQPQRSSTGTPETAAAQGPPARLTGKVGGEKAGFLNDPETQRVLARYNLTIDWKKEGSVEMVREPGTGLHFLWPASQVNVENFRELGNSPAQAEDVFHSPVVFYSWDIITDALITNGIVQVVNGSYLIVDLPKLVEWVEQKKKWKEVGLPQLTSTVSIQSTDPTRSNSGNMFAALLANTYNGGEVVTPDKAEQVIAKVKAFFDRLGFMEASSGTLFDKYLKQGAGAYPLIVGYENQLIEFVSENRQLVEPVKKRLRILYPRPTVWASHPMIALNAEGKRLIAALKDPELLKIAWERHGLRAGYLGAVNTATAPVEGIPSTIDGVMPLPSLAVMNRLTDALASPLR